MVKKTTEVKASSEEVKASSEEVKASSEEVKASSEEVKASSEEVKASSELVTRQVPILNVKGLYVLKMKTSLVGKLANGQGYSYRPQSLQFFEKKEATRMIESNAAVMVDPSQDLSVNEVLELNQRFQSFRG